MSPHDEPDSLRTRVGELETRVRDLQTLCSDIYVAATELGLPQPLLHRLWKVVGQGTTPQAFAFDLPPRPATSMATSEQPTQATQPAEQPKAAPRPEPPNPPGLKPLPTRLTVLVVDDDPMMLEVLFRVLRRENYDLLVAADGPKALATAEAHPRPVDLLITDCEMPEIKGPELADRLRARYPGLKVLFQTGFSDMVFESRPVLDDDSAFLEKPFTARGLCEAARLLAFGALNPKP